MRQRLAVVSALLKSPELLILDEPANGLDPAGIREMRDLMRTVVASGATVVLSSHILGEVQHLCDSVTIISRGRRVVAGPVADVLATQDKGEFRVRVDDPVRAAEVLSGGGATVRPTDDHLVVSGVPDPAWITGTLAGHDSMCGDGSVTCKPVEWSVSWPQSALVGGILVAVVVAASPYAFRRRVVARLVNVRPSSRTPRRGPRPAR
jgi:putative AbiEii toxin of type IV toxin-antitoxin system